MNPRLKQLLRAAIPAVALAPLQRRFRRVRWTGDYPNWAAASAASGGYDAPAILEKVLAAAREVRAGRAAYERDGVLFAEPAEPGPVVEWLRRWGAADGGRIHALDFGGSLGSTYFQVRPQLAGMALRWDVVEQPAFVEAGRKELADDELQFFVSPEEALGRGRPGVLLLASVLPYLENPHAILAQLAALRIPRVLIDRTGLAARAKDRLTVQHVPRNIYPASYPCWLFNRDRLLAPFAADYQLCAEYRTADGESTGMDFRGFVLERRGSKT